MLCEECKKRYASVHVKKIIQGKKEEMHLCEECARTKDNISFENNFSIHNFLAGLLDGYPDSPLTARGYSQSIKCESCGTLYAEFKQVGRLGCEQCYKSFSQVLAPLFRKIHSNTRHTGKIPKKSGGKIRIQNEINKLKLKLKHAVEAEEFEKAVELRDQIRQLQDEMQEMQGGI